MAKLNIIWEKALEQLSERKLVVLMSELKIQDKQELTLKKIKADNGDKEGKMEAQMRKKLLDLMNRFKLGRSPDEKPSEQKELKNLFKDKKLNKLWKKAEASGLTQVELKALKEEFEHHQAKMDQYYQLVEDASSVNNALKDDMAKFDHLSSLESDVPEAASVNSLREKHRNLKDGYDRLHKISSAGEKSGEFVEPKVQGLWRMAAQADFNQEELESLHTELRHYENRLLKLRHLTGDLLRMRKTDPEDEGETHPDPDMRLQMKLDEVSPERADTLLQERLTKQRRTVDKLHDHLEERILARHSEL